MIASNHIYVILVFTGWMGIFIFLAASWYTEELNLASSTTNRIVITGHVRPERTIYKNKYVPAQVERELMKNLKRLGWNETASQNAHRSKTCSIWTNSTLIPVIHQKLHEYKKELDTYHNYMKAPSWSLSDIMDAIRKRGTDICENLKFGKENGLMSFFPSGQLSFSRSGYIEPLLPPFRHPNFCYDGSYLMRMEYLVIDFETMCYNLKPYSRRVLIDLGASLLHHHADQPIFFIIDLFKKNGFNFDHVYAFEASHVDPKKVYSELLPKSLIPTYHWINAPVNTEFGHPLNPLDSVLRQFNEDDLIILKIDIDTPEVELALVQQILNDTSLHTLIDHLFFEYHVVMAEMTGAWGSFVKGSAQDSLELFYKLRQLSVPVHFWP